VSKLNGFCLRRDEHGLVGVSISTTGQGWRVDELSRSVPGGKPSRDLQNALGKATTPVTWLLADNETGMSHLTMPKLRKKALQKAFGGGLARDHGGSPDDWYLAYKTLSQVSGPGAPGNQPYVLYHTEKALANEIVSEARNWGANIERMLPSHLALDLFYRTHGPGRDEQSVWNLVFVGEKQQFLCVATSDAQLVIRNLPANLSTDQDGQEYLSRLVTEIERSAFFARQTEHSPEVQKIIVCGDPKVAAPLTGMLAESSPTPAVHWAIEEMFEWGLNEQQSDDLLVLAGAVVALTKSPFNLLPGQGPLHFSRSLRRQLLVGATACAVAAVPVLMVGGIVTARIQENYLVRAHGRLAEAQERAHQAELAYDAQNLLLAREDRIRHFARTRPDFEEVLLRLAALTPEEVVFKDLQVREQLDGRFFLQLDGESRADSGVKAQGAFLDFLTALDNCDFLDRLGEPRVMQMKPGETSGQESTTRKTTVFHLELNWRGDEKGDG
jgi:hypothetical protein